MRNQGQGGEAMAAGIIGLVILVGIGLFLLTVKLTPYLFRGATQTTRSLSIAVNRLTGLFPESLTTNPATSAVLGALVWAGGGLTRSICLVALSATPFLIPILLAFGAGGGALLGFASVHQARERRPQTLEDIFPLSADYRKEE